MNICLTCNYSPWSAYAGGGQMVTHNLAKQLVKTGHRVFVVYTTSEKIVPSEDVNYEIIWARDVGKYKHRWRGFNIFPVLCAVQKLSSQTRIDQLHGAADEAALPPHPARKDSCVF